jgi:hypothetical protein
LYPHARRWAKWNVDKALQRILALGKWYKTHFPDEVPTMWKHSDFAQIFDSGISRS